MCGIGGFSTFQTNYLHNFNHWSDILHLMNRQQHHRGPDEDGVFLDSHCGFAHVRLRILDLYTGQQPMSRTQDGRTCTICCNGEIYNMPQLRKELEQVGVHFTTHSDTEVILLGYMLYGESYISKLNGIFAIALWDSYQQTLYLFRDRLGIKPLFYTNTLCPGSLIFSSELKGLFAYPGIHPVLNTDSLCEIFALGPAKTCGKGVFEDIYEILPGHYLTWQDSRLTDHCYWQIESKPHEDSYEETLEKTRDLIEDAVSLQTLSDTPICTFLSGGIDSSLVTAICAQKLKKEGKILNTFSFDFEGNQKFFQSNSFQPSQDRPYVDQMVAFADTNHHYLECDNENLIDYLYRAVDARDLPCMADVESSMLYFCSQVVKYNKVALTGECADEIFGGYPWFHEKEAFKAETFPWSKDLSARQVLLREDLIHDLPMAEYVKAAYDHTIQTTPRLSTDNPQERRRREIAWLNLRWFMITLLDRMDRTSMFNGLEARVPFADHRIVEYIWNVPWAMKQKNHIVKGLLRQAAVGKVPDTILWRKKSPYPKTYHPQYEKLLGQELTQVLTDPNAPILQFLDPGKVKKFLNSPHDYGKPWYGQLMAGPQMIAYMLQINYWLKQYPIRIKI